MLRTSESEVTAIPNEGGDSGVGICSMTEYLMLLCLMSTLDWTSWAQVNTCSDIALGPPEEIQNHRAKESRMLI